MVFFFDFFLILWYNMCTLRGRVIMRRKNKEFELDLEEYIDDDYDENFYNENNSKTLSTEEEEYNNFFKVDDDYDTDYVVNTDDEDNYADFIKEYDTQIEENNSTADYDDYDDDEENEENEARPYYTYDSDNGIYKFLSMFLVIFKWIGVAIAIILIAYFTTQGNMKSLLMYIIGLVFAFFFGYIFMFILNKFTED